jgi:hypothetical protein
MIRQQKDKKFISAYTCIDPKFGTASSTDGYKLISKEGERGG